MLTATQLRQIMPNLQDAKAATLLPHLNEAMAEYGINTMQRAAAFIAQLAHESGEFRWMEEIWGPTAAQRRYEPETDLSKRLGNSRTGDGFRFKGRGPIQLTGRANYQRFGGLLGVDLVAAPEQAAAPQTAFRVAALYWKNRGLNELADAEDFREITRRINGGFNGLADREKYFERAKEILATAFEATAGMAGRAFGAAVLRRVPAEPLTRGFEAIRELAATKKKSKKAKKATAKKATAKKAAAKKAAAKKVSATAKASTRKPPAKKAGVKKRAAKTRATTKAAPAKSAARKAAGKKRATKKPAAKKASKALARRR